MFPQHAPEVLCRLHHGALCGYVCLATPIALHHHHRKQTLNYLIIIVINLYCPCYILNKDVLHSLNKSKIYLQQDRSWRLTFLTIFGMAFFGITFHHKIQSVHLCLEVQVSCKFGEIPEAVSNYRNSMHEMHFWKVSLVTLTFELMTFKS